MKNITYLLISTVLASLGSLICYYLYQTETVKNEHTKNGAIASFLILTITFIILTHRSVDILKNAKLLFIEQTFRRLLITAYVLIIVALIIALIIFLVGYENGSDLDKFILSIQTISILILIIPIIAEMINSKYNKNKSNSNKSGSNNTFINITAPTQQPYISSKVIPQPNTSSKASGTPSPPFVK